MNMIGEGFSILNWDVIDFPHNMTTRLCFFTLTLLMYEVVVITISLCHMTRNMGYGLSNDSHLIVNKIESHYGVESRLTVSMLIN